MKFIKAVIHLHDAFTLGRIKTLEIDFTKSNVFIILGSNGSGKSSLLQLLLNWPDDHQRYQPGGYKTVEILNEGSLYSLTCQHNGQDKYVLIKEGQTVYKGSHGQMFASMVQEHLGFSKLYKSLLLENAQVTKMNSAQRSQWLMDLSGIDYTWALALYDKLKSKRNMFSGSSKVNAQRLAQMSQEVISDSDEAKLRDKQKQLLRSVDYMHSVRVPPSMSVEDALDSLSQHKQSFKSLLNKISSNRYINVQADSIEGVQAVLERLKGTVIAQQSLINHKHELAQQCRNIIEEQSTQSLEVIKNQIDLTTLELNQKVTTLTICSLDDLNICHRAYKDYTHLNSWIVDYSSNLKSAGVYSPEELTKSKDTHHQALSRSHELQAALERISLRIEHYENHLSNGNVDCPNCKHSFIAGYNLSDHQSSKEKLTLVKELIQAHNVTLTKVKNELNHQEHKKELWYTWSKFVNDYGYMGHWLNAIMVKFTQEGIDLNSTWERLGVEIQRLIECRDLYNKINVLDSKMALAKNKDAVMVDKASQELIVYNQQLDTLSKKLKVLSDLVVKFDKRLTDMKQYDSLKNQITQSHVKTSELLKNIDEVHRQHYFNHALQQMQQDLASVQFQIKKVDQSSAMIEGVKTNLEQDKYMAQCWGALSKAMSPKDGIIGKSLVAFLSEFFDNINDFISQVWTYELQVMPIEITDDGQLDMSYDFKMVQDGKVLKDIGMGSAAMKYIVDLAFRLTALLRLKNSGIAMLDEPFTSLDQSHRSQASFAMRSLIESDLFEQLFIISHHSEFHDIFTSANVICLDPRNISVPSHANNCVKITHY